MSDLIKQDSQARLEALDPTRSFIVQAPAGSGKTELLTQRYLKLLASINKGPQEIIAVTFTKKAAAEMRSRIVNALIDAKTHQQAPELAHAKLTWQLAKAALEQCEAKHWDIIAYPNQLRILTIDALCSHLASRMPILSHFGAEPDITCDPTDLYQKAVQALVNGLISGSAEEQAFKVLLKQVDNRLNVAEDLLIMLLAKRDQWLGHMTQLAGKALEQGLTRIIIDRLEKGYVAMKNSTPYLPEPTVDNLPSWQALQDLFLTQKGEFRKRAQSNQNIYPKQMMKDLLEACSESEPIHIALKNLSDLPPAQLSFEQNERLESLTKLLPLLTAHLLLQFKDSGKVDFIEVALRAKAALGENERPTDLALSLDYQLQHLLIDEFQDTSYSQFALFEKLVAGWSRGDARTLFLVGDPMQSIYRFRGAEVGLFLEVQQKGLNQVKLKSLKLTRNFRSTTPIVEWINTHFKTIFPAIENSDLGAVAYSPAIAQPSSDLDQGVYFYSDLDNIAQLLQTVSKAGQSVAILVRSKSHLSPILPLLRQLRIPFEAHDIEPLGFKQIILDLLSLTQALLDYSDKMAWLAILRAPWCGLTLVDLTPLAVDECVWTNLLNYRELDLTIDARLRIERILPILEYWIYHRQRHTFSAWIKGIWYALGGPACYEDSAVLSQAQVFFELLDKESEGGDLEDIAAFEKKLESLYAPGQVSAAAFEGISPIQLMSIHKSKGLEFDIVIVPGLEKTTRPSETELLLWYERKHEKGIDLIVAPRKADSQLEDGLYQHVRSELSKKAELENARLLYVALTRAKKQIHLFGQISDRNPVSGSFLSYLWPGVQFDAISSVGAGHRAGPLNRWAGTVTGPYDMLKRLPSNWPTPIQIPDVQEGEGDLNHPNHTYQIDKLIGIFVHRILQLIAELGLEHWDNIALSGCIPSWTQGLNRLGVKANDLSFALNTVMRAVQETLNSSIGRHILGKHHIGAHNEWGLHYQTPQGPKQIIIDRTFVDKDGIRWIIDYKLAEELTDAHCQQVRHYAKIVSQLENRDIQSIRCALYFPLKLQGDCWKEIKLC